MKTLKYIFVLILVLGTFHSCLVDNKTKYDMNASEKNLAGFEDNKTLVSAIADGTEYSFPQKVRVVGPTVKDLKNDVTLTVEVDQALMDETVAADTNLIAAVEGVHYRIADPVVVLKKSNNYLGLVDVKMITTGIVTPLPKAPYLALKTKTAIGDANVVNNAKPLEINMNFACFSELQGTYTVTHTRTSGGTPFSREEQIIKVGVEQYQTASVGIWGTPPFTDYGFIFDNACYVLSVPHQSLANSYSNDTWSHNPGNVNPVTGVITIYYTIAFAAGNQTYTAVYVPVVK